MNLDFETQSDLLERKIIDPVGERITLPDYSLKSEYNAKLNAALDWV